jgi:hypothetical protein
MPPKKPKLCFYTFITLLALISSVQAEGDKTIFVKHGSMVILPDTTYIIKNDTLISLPFDVQYQIREIPDAKSADFYNSLGSKASKNKLTDVLFKSIVTSGPPEMTDSIQFRRSEDAFFKYEGKTIGKIRLKKIRILAGSVYDTLEVIETPVSKAFNGLHIQTRDRILRYNLLFAEGDSIDPYLLADNERILRELPYLEDAKILVQPRQEGSEFVDVVVITKDVFSLGISPTLIDAYRYRMAVYERNLLGIGSEIRYTMEYDRRISARTGYDIKYEMNNILGTFINGTFRHRDDPDGLYNQLIFNKPFLTPQTRYGGAINFETARTERVEIQNDSLVKTPFSNGIQDIWLGRSFHIGEVHSRRNLIIAARVRNEDYIRRPTVFADSNFFYHDKKLFLASLTLKRIYYFQSSMILSFGITEDFPIGYRIDFTTGYASDEFSKKPYFGIEVGGAKLWPKLGYFASSMEYGGFFDEGRLQEGIFRTRLFYFTPLSRLAHYGLRQLLFVSWTYGVNRIPGQAISLDNSIRGIVGGIVSGTNRIRFNVESIAFAPWNVFGFRFALYGYGDVGFISNSLDLLNRRNVYGTVGIGCRIRNESLVLRTLQIRIGYFPRLPRGQSQIDLDISTNDPSLSLPIDAVFPAVIGFN